MDCTSGTSRPDVGCEGGLMEYVFEYAKDHPIALDTEVPYRERQGQCPNTLLSHVKVENYKVVMIEENPKAEQQFEYILHNYGPIGIGIDSENMDNYRGGIFTADQCGKDIDHAVTIIGYTKDAWIIKNSWGPNWGVGGYLLLERGTNACGVAEYGVYVSNAEPIHEIMKTDWYMESI
jgi:cathepsin L